MIQHHSLSVVLFLAPHRPDLHSIHQVGHNWIYRIYANKTEAKKIISNLACAQLKS